MQLVRLIPRRPRTVTPGDIEPPVFANRSTFFPIRVASPIPVTMGAPPRNVSTFGRHRLTTGTEGTLTVPLLTNVSALGSHEVAVSGADGYIRMTSFSNISTFGTHEVDVSFEDGYLRPPAITNVSTFGSHVLSADTSSDEFDGMIAGDMIAGGMI